MKIKHESLPSRCSICHQTDKYNPVMDSCERCGQLINKKSILVLNTLSRNQKGELIRNKYYSPATEALKQQLDNYAKQETRKDITKLNLLPKTIMTPKQAIILLLHSLLTSGVIIILLLIMIAIVKELEK